MTFLIGFIGIMCGFGLGIAAGCIAGVVGSAVVCIAANSFVGSI